MSLGIRLIKKKRGLRDRSLRDRSGLECDSELNFRHGGHKRCKTITPTTVRGSLEDDFFDDIESSSIKPAYLDEVTSSDLLPPFFFYKRRQSGARFRSVNLSFFSDR